MHLSQALDVINHVAPNQIEALSDLLPLNLIEQALAQTDTVTLRKRKFSLESMVWLTVGMAIYNEKPLNQIVNILDIVNREGALLWGYYTNGITPERDAIGCSLLKRILVTN